MSTSPLGEPQLGRRGLTRRRGGEKGGDHEMALLWVMNLADGAHTLVDCAERSGLPFAAIRAAADALREAGLLQP
ncbi:MAG: winged helix-turn-helix domain-containing protein [Thermoleophilia bacterium]